MTPLQRLALSSRNRPTKKTGKRRSRQLFLESLESRQLLATFVVNTFADTQDAAPGDGLAADASGFTSLRAAITEANALAGEDRIELSAGTYSLTRTAANEGGNVAGDLDVRDDLVIVGAGSGVTTINAAAVNDRIFEIIARGVNLSKFTRFTLSGVTLTGGVANQLDSTADRGGAIRMDLQSTAIISDCVFLNNRAPKGGAPLFREGDGGAIFSDGNLTITNCRFEGNVASRFGGAIWANASFTQTIIRNSMFVNNRAVFGGAIRMATGMTVENSTFTGNVARSAAGTSGQGGAIENMGGNVTLTNTTLSGNDSFSGGGLFSTGNAITRLNYVTFAFNTSNYGGGWHTNAGTGSATSENSIFAGNSASVNGVDVRFAVSSLGFNLIGNTAGSSGWKAGDLANVDPILAPLADNGGPVWTHALSSGSPAGDAGNPNSTLTVDARGFVRPRDVNGEGIFAPDLGALEVQTIWPPIVAAGGPYVVEEGGSVGLDASGSQSRQQDPTLQFAWDFDGDGEFDDASGATPTFSAAAYDGPTTVTVSVRVTDSLGAFSDGSTTVEVGNVAPSIDSVSLNPVANYFVTGPISLAALFSDAGLTDTHTATIDWGDGAVDVGQVSEASGSGQATGSHSYSTSGNHTIAVTVVDDDGASDTWSITIFVAGFPTADAGGPYSVVEGGSVVLNAGGSTSQQTDQTLLYAWDFDGDGQFDDASGAAPTFSAAVHDGPSSVVVAVQVTDSQGLVDVATATVQVTNAAPTIQGLTVNPSDSATVGSPVSLTVEFGDASAADAHSVAVNWGDGSSGGGNVSESGGGVSGSATHAYTAAGTYTIVVTVTDDDGASVQTSHQIVIDGGGDLVVDGVLRLIGTDNADRVAFRKLDDGSLFVETNFLPSGSATFAAGVVRTILAHLRGGDDVLTVAQNVHIPIVADGGSGHDRLSGGGDRDLLIGGLGADILLGSNGDDILIAGTTSYDDNDDALLAILAEWNSGGKYEKRVANVRVGGNSLAGTGIRLSKGATVFADDSADRLTGGNGRDWFFTDNGQDTVTDRTSNELRNDDLTAAMKKKRRR